MGTYFFDISNRDESFQDTGGVDCESLPGAHFYAVELICKTMLFDKAERNWRGWHVDIADSSGRHLLTVLYPPNGQVPRRTLCQQPAFHAALPSIDSRRA